MPSNYSSRIKDTVTHNALKATLHMQKVMGGDDNDIVNLLKVMTIKTNSFLLKKSIEQYEISDLDLTTARHDIETYEQIIIERANSHHAHINVFKISDCISSRAEHLRMNEVANHFRDIASSFLRNYPNNPQASVDLIKYAMGSNLFYDQSKDELQKRVNLETALELAAEGKLHLFSEFVEIFELTHTIDQSSLKLLTFAFDNITQNPDLAIKFLDKFVSTYGAEKEYHAIDVLRGNIFRAQNKHNEARKWYQEAIKLNPESVAHSCIVDLSYSQENYKQALDDIDHATLCGVDLANLCLIQSDYALKLKQFDIATQIVETALYELPINSSFDLCLQLVKINIAAGRQEEALKQAEFAEHIFNQFFNKTTTPLGIAKLYDLMGDIYIQNSATYEKAIAFYRKATIDLKNDKLHLKLGKIYQKQSKFKDALQEYKEAHKLNNLIKYINCSFECYRELQLNEICTLDKEVLELGVKIYNNLLQEFKQFGPFKDHNFLAKFSMIHRGLRNFKEAEAKLKEAYEITPESEYKIALADLYMEMQQYADAILLYKSDQSFHSYIQLSIAFTHQNNFNSVIEFYQKATLLAPEALKPVMNKLLEIINNLNDESIDRAKIIAEYFNKLLGIYQQMECAQRALVEQQEQDQFAETTDTSIKLLEKEGVERLSHLKKWTTDLLGIYQQMEGGGRELLKKEELLARSECQTNAISGFNKALKKQTEHDKKNKALETALNAAQEKLKAQNQQAQCDSKKVQELQKLLKELYTKLKTSEQHQKALEASVVAKEQALSAVECKRKEVIAVNQRQKDSIAQLAALLLEAENKISQVHKPRQKDATTQTEAKYKPGANKSETSQTEAESEVVLNLLQDEITRLRNTLNQYQEKHQLAYDELFTRQLKEIESVAMELQSTRMQNIKYRECAEQNTDLLQKYAFDCYRLYTCELDSSLGKIHLEKYQDIISTLTRTYELAHDYNGLATIYWQEAWFKFKEAKFVAAYDMIDKSNRTTENLEAHYLLVVILYFGSNDRDLQSLIQQNSEQLIQRAVTEYQHCVNRPENREGKYTPMFHYLLDNDSLGNQLLSVRHCMEHHELIGAAPYPVDGL